jgi:hypothetical protein
MMRDTDSFKNNTFGLKTMDDANKLWFYKGPGGHMHITDEYIDTYLVPLLRGDTPAPS